MAYQRHTMGQDWGGRHADNPKDAPRVTRAQVLALAFRLRIRLRRMRYAWTSWWILERDGVWRTFENTNYLAYQRLVQIEAGNEGLFHPLRAALCPTCQGAGKTVCDSCDGSGQKKNKLERESDRCYVCYGSGKIGCIECQGTGLSEKRAE